MLEKLEWPSLEGRWKLSRLTMFQRVVNRNVDIEKDLYLTPFSHTSRDGNSMLSLRPHQHANNFFPWTILHWNKLPGDIVNINDNDIFKSAIRNHLIKQRRVVLIFNFKILFYFSFYFISWQFLRCYLWNFLSDNVTIIFVKRMRWRMLLYQLITEK